jgi:hypothetical protein
MNGLWRGLALWATLLGPASAQVPVDTTETWNAPGTAGWTNGSAATVVSNPAEYLNLAHRLQGAPMMAEDIVRCPIPPGTRLTTVSFRFLAQDKAPSAVWLCLHGAQSGNTWYAPLTRPTAGEEVTYSVPLNLQAGGWFLGADNREEVFEADAQLADWVGIYVRRNFDPAAQNYRIDDFRMQGVYVDDVDGDGMPNTWELTYRLRPDWSGDGAGDSDGDRFNNFAEYWAGTRPDDGDSYFHVRVEEGAEPGGVTLVWDSIPGRRYAVWEGTNASAPLERCLTGIAATPATNRLPVAAGEGRNARFFRVEVERP